MKTPRRRFLRLAAGAAAIPAASRIAAAQNYPTRPVRIVAGFSPGGITDLYARLIAQWLSERTGQQFIVENRTGAGGSLAAESVARASPDGYTLLLTTASDPWNTALYDNLKFDYLRDIAPVASISRGMDVLVVNPSFPAKSVPEFIAYARGNPGKVTIGSGGVGSTPHICWALFTALTSVETVHVPYRGEGPALTDLFGGQVQALFPTIPGAIEHIRAGRLLPLAVTAATRAQVLPEIPSLAEFVPGYDATYFIGIGAPKNTPVRIVDQVNQDINASLADPRLDRRIDELGDAAFASSPAEFGKFITEFTDKWAKVIRAAGIKAG
jgi:tripartite-type tricarboxylate transporter receptor subunit TctC